MKFTFATAFLVSSASAFTATTSTNSKTLSTSSPLRMSDATVDELDNGVLSKLRPIYDPLGLYPENAEERKEGRIRSLEPEVTVRKPVLDPLGLYSKEANLDNDAVMSTALPFQTRPLTLTGSMPGDAGFDPFNFADSEEKLLNLREAEIKHARIAMLAAAGWPLSELFHKQLANMFNLKPLLGFGDRVPSVLNGGLTKVSPVYWGLILALAGGIELYGMKRASENDPEYFPGNLNFDPLGLYPKDEAKQKDMQLAEIKNGRLAMFAIVGFAIQEFVTNIGVVNQTPSFFQPITEFLQQLTNNGMN